MNQKLESFGKKGSFYEVSFTMITIKVRLMDYFFLLMLSLMPSLITLKHFIDPTSFSLNEVILIWVFFGLVFLTIKEMRKALNEALKRDLSEYEVQFSGLAAIIPILIMIPFFLLSVLLALIEKLKGLVRS